MDWRRKKQIAKLVDGILENNTLKRQPYTLFYDIMKERKIIYEEHNENDENFCGVYMVNRDVKIIFVNSNITPIGRKNFTIAHELGHHFLGHTLKNGALICDKSALNAKNKQRPEREKEADYFAACFLMPKDLVVKATKKFNENYNQQLGLFQNNTNKQKQEDLLTYLSNYFQVSEEAMGYRLDELSK